MGKDTAIEWARHTFNPWRGCARVSEGCRHCYAETLSKRNPKVLGVWGVDGTRVVASEAMWREPVKWNAAAAALGDRHRVFCASLADWLEDRPDLVAPRARLIDMIAATPNLEWLLLTKRPENFQRLAPAAWQGRCPSNVRVGVTAENQPEADKRLPFLLDIPAVNFVSVEPMLAFVDLRRWLPMLDHVIGGGESGAADARPMHPDWIRDLRDQCLAAGVPFLFKQWGDWQNGSKVPDWTGEIVLNDGRRAPHAKDFGHINEMEWGRLHPSIMAKVGKKAAGRELDGREWNEFPAVRQ